MLTEKITVTKTTEEEFGIYKLKIIIINNKINTAKIYLTSRHIMSLGDFGYNFKDKYCIDNVKKLISKCDDLISALNSFKYLLQKYLKETEIHTKEDF